MKLGGKNSGFRKRLSKKKKKKKSYFARARVSCAHIFFFLITDFLSFCLSTMTKNPSPHSFRIAIAIDIAVQESVFESVRTSTDVNSRKFVGGGKNGALGLSLGGSRTEKERWRTAGE